MREQEAAFSRRRVMMLALLGLSSTYSFQVLTGRSSSSHSQALERWIRGTTRPHRIGFPLKASGKGFGKSKKGDESAGSNPKKSSSSTGGGGSASSDKKVLRMPPFESSSPAASSADAVQASSNRKFQMLYTCNICQGRNLIAVDKIAFTEGIVIAKCKHCDSKHLVADNLSKLDFGKGKVTLDDIMALRGEEVKYMDLKANPDLAKYDLEMLDDGTVELSPKHQPQKKDEEAPGASGGEAQ